jgi:hypothetical protein
VLTSAALYRTREFIRAPLEVWGIKLACLRQVPTPHIGTAFAKPLSLPKRAVHPQFLRGWKVHPPAEGPDYGFGVIVTGYAGLTSPA